jgi:predicted nucleic acid-binding protein
MIVVADSSPMIALIEIGHIDVLPGLFYEIIIPPQVSAKMRQFCRSQLVHHFFAAPHTWLTERVPKKIEVIPALHAGELAAISLAQELKAELLLIDEIDGRKAAADRHIPLTGTIGVLESAADRGLLDLRDAFEKIKETGFWISHRLLDERLELYAARRKPR